MPGPDLTTRHKPDACPKVTPSAKLEWIVATLQRQQGEQQPGWPPPSTPPPTPPGGGAVLDLEVSSMPSNCKDELSCKPCNQADIKMNSEHLFSTCTSRVSASKASTCVVAISSSESLTSVDCDTQNLSDHSSVSQTNCEDRISEPISKKNASDSEMTDQCKTSSSFGVSSSEVVCVTQAQSRPVPSSICRIPKKRGLVLAEDKPETVTDVDSGCQEASASNSLASASDFLQKLVQEQKSQVPTLFCRSDEKTCSAKVLSNNVPNTKANANLIKLLKKADNQHADASRSQVDLETKSPGKTQFTFQYDSVSSDDEVESVTTKDESVIINKAQRIAETTVTPSEPASGKLRFYLDGRFVLELTHAASGTSSSSTGWVQSKGKIWTPSSEASDSGALRVGVGKPAIDTPCPPPRIRPVSCGEGISSVNSPFLLRIGRAVRAIYLCWLTSKELRKAARNPTVDASLLYQAALTRNSPIMGMARMDKNLKMKLSSCQRKRRRRRPLRGIWKELFTHTASSPCPGGSFTSALTAEQLTEEETKANHSLLLDALTKPKTRDISDGNEVGTNSSTFLSSITVSIPVESKDSAPNCKRLTDKSETDGYSRTVESGLSRDCKPLVQGGSPSANPEHTASVLLPLPEWYLDPSKAEVPISEMIGYPRPYFPPAAVHNNPCHIIRKRQQGSSPVPQFSPPNGKRVRLKQEQHLKECVVKEASTNVLKAVGEKVEIRTTTEWPLWPTKVEPEESSSVSTLPVSLVCSSRRVEPNSSQSSITHMDLATKVRNAKRFGSYGRGHAVNDAIRTFVISDIVNLGGDLKTRYVPRGVYSEVASRYKVDVSTTTRWWLRHCAEKEQDKKLSSATATVPTMKSDLPRPVLERGVHETASVKVEVGTERLSPSAVHRLSWGSSVTSSPSRMPSIISAHTRPMSEPLWSSGLNSRLSDQAAEIPYTISKRSSSMEKVAASNPIEDGPLDLRVTSKRLRTVAEPVKSTVDAVVPSAHHLAASVRPPSVEYTVRNDRMLCTQSPTYTRDHTFNDKLAESNVQSLSPCEQVSISESRLASHDDRINHWVGADHSVRTSIKPHKSVAEAGHNGDLSDRSTFSPSSDEVLDVGSHETTSPISFCKSGPAVVSTEFPMLSSALKSPLPPESNGLARKNAVEEHSSQEERPVLTRSTCSESNATNSDVYTGVNSKFGTRGYPSLPVPPIHSEYPPLGPPPAGLPPWPYPPCPLMAYGPALVNSYYYCCCFLPGCRFHYVYTADGRPVDPRETSPSPLVLADNYSKCFSGVADVSPLMYNSVRSEQVYKNWTSPVSEPRTANASPSSPTPAREQDDDNDKVQPEDPQSTESTGSMLKDLLLKPSRTTPDRAQPLVTSSKTLVVNEKVPVTCKPVKVENFLNSHRDHVHGVVSPPAASPSLTAKECSAKLSRARGSSPLASPRAKKDETISSDLSKSYWESSTFPKSSCQPKHYSFQMGTILDTEES